MSAPYERLKRRLRWTQDRLKGTRDALMQVAGMREEVERAHHRLDVLRADTDARLERCEYRVAVLIGRMDSIASNLESLLNQQSEREAKAWSDMRDLKSKLATTDYLVDELLNGGAPKTTTPG